MSGQSGIHVQSKFERSGRIAPRGKVLVLDDETSIQRLLKMILEEEGHEVFVTDDGAEALKLMGTYDIDLVIHDIRMPKMNGIAFLKEITQRNPQAIAIVMTAFGSWETAVEAMRLGAYSHIGKPFDTEDIRQLVHRALERREIAKVTPKDGGLPFMDIVGNAPPMRAVVNMIKRVAPTDSTVFIYGESGTGKELVARSVHYNSLRAHGPFVPVNCGAFTETLLESELFGHVRGAFTNAVSDRKGLFAVADTGTLFLDEIGEMTLTMQVKFLRVLESRVFKPVGGTKECKADVRLIAATNRNLAQLVKEGKFREDLYHRLNVIPLTLPPLRERLSDIPMLAGHFLARYAKRMNKKVTSIEESALRCLVTYHWPGNVRELENTIERAVALCLGTSITDEDIIGPMSPGERSRMVTAALNLTPPLGAPLELPVSGPAVEKHSFQPQIHVSVLPQTAPMASAATANTDALEMQLPNAGIDLEQHLLTQERSLILQALDRTDWNITEAAKLLGMSFRSMRYRISKLNIRKPGRDEPA